MARDNREPQSYGSGEDWVTGRTGQRVSDPKAEPEPEHAQFYDERRESDTSEPDQGGHLSEFQLADGAEPSDYVSGSVHAGSEGHEPRHRSQTRFVFP